MAEKLVPRIKGTAKDIHGEIMAGKKPSLRFPLRSLANVRYAVAKGLLRAPRQAQGAHPHRRHGQDLRPDAAHDGALQGAGRGRTTSPPSERPTTSRKNWGDARFDEQPESDTVMDDVEALFGVNREQLGFIPEEKGGDVAGRLVVIDRDPRHRRGAAASTARKFGSRRLLDPDLGRAPPVRDQGQVHPRHRDRRHVPAPGQAQLLEDRRTAS